MSARDISLRYIDVVNSHDSAAFIALYADHAVVHDSQLPGPISGPGPIQADYETFLVSFPDVHFEPRAVVDSTDAVAFDGTITGTHKGDLVIQDGRLPATGKSIEVPAALFLHLAPDGKIVEERRYFDAAQILIQLGLMPS